MNNSRDEHMSPSENNANGSSHANTGLIAYFAGNPVAVNLLLALFLAGGIISGLQLAVQYFPDIEARQVDVVAEYPGASPEEVEEDINRRIEEAVVGLAGVDRVVGKATEGQGLLAIHVADFADPDDVLERVQSAIIGIERFPPAGAERPEVELWQPAPEVVSLVVTSSEHGENRLRIVAEAVRDELLELPSVSQVTLRGTRDREISIELSEEELRRHDLSIAMLTRSVRSESLNLTMGEIRTQSGGVVLHIVAKREIGKEFENIPLITKLDGTIVRLGDVAVVRDGFADEDLASFINGEEAIFVHIDATEEQSVVAIAEEVQGLLAEFPAPDGFSVRIWKDSASPVVDRLFKLVNNGVLGAMLVFICLLLVFDLRVAWWIAVGIPLSFIGALLFFGPADQSLNLGTLFGFFLLIGIVVDDAVVVGESIAAERERGLRGIEAAVSGARAVVGPVTIGALTTILAFIPFLFVTAPRYQIVNVFPFIAIVVLLVSLFGSFFILPAHLSKDRQWSLSPLREIQRRMRSHLDDLRDSVVAPAAALVLRRVWVTPTIAILVLVGSVLMLRSEMVRVILFDNAFSRTDVIEVDLQMPVGTPFEEMQNLAFEVADAAHAVNDQLDGSSVRAVGVLVGQTGRSTIGLVEEPGGSHLANVSVKLNDRPLREATPNEIERAWRANMGDVSQFEYVKFHTGLFGQEPSLAYALKHDDPEVLAEAAEAMKSFLAGIPGVYGIADSLVLGKRQFEIDLTPAGIAAGLSPASIGVQLRASFHGEEVQRIQRGRDEVKVVVRYPPDRRRSLSELSSVRIRRPGGQEVPLTAVADITEKRSLAELNRIDGRRVALVNAYTDGSVITPIQARRLIRSGLIADMQSAFPGLVVEAEGGERSERSMLRTMSVLVPLVLIAMYGLMAALLRSYWKPAVAVAGIPFAFSGAVVSHWILGWDLSAMSMFGVVAVSGVVVNDALVLLDRYNKIRVEKPLMPAIAVVIAATRQRFRAVLLTSLTTIIGLSPLLYQRSDDLVTLVPFVVSMLGGLVFSTLSILFVLPSLVMIVEGYRE